MKLLELVVGNVDIGKASESSVDAVDNLLFGDDLVDDVAGFLDDFLGFRGQLNLRSAVSNFENLGEGERPRLDCEHVP